ncbi:MAG: alpha-hydroxy acid oxidase [Stappiaceae bacterium]
MFLNAEIHSYADARRLAKRRLPWMVFDYIDGAAGDETGEVLNRETLKSIRLQPRILRNVADRSLSVSLFGKEAGLPFSIAPMGMCDLARPGADKLLAHLAAKHSIPLGVSTAASSRLEDMIELAEGNAWFQLYFSGEEKGALELIERARIANYQTLVLTVDTPEVGRRPRELRRGFKMPFKIGPSQFIDFAFHPRWSLTTLVKGRPRLANSDGYESSFVRTASRAGADWSFLEKVRESWQGNLVVKGVLNVEDAMKVKEFGADAIQVSSHGGRQLESTPPPILALQKIRQAIGPGFPLFFDTGLRSGEDIVKAYAMGADFAFLGRPMSFAIAANGETGLNQMCDVLAEEISITLAQIGLTDMSGVSASSIWQ